jgi:hypothetical protein
LKIAEIIRDRNPLLIVPGPHSNSVAGVHCRLAGPRLCAEVSMPGLVARPDGSRELLAMRIGPCKSAEISAIAHSDARNEKAHRMRLGPRRLGERENRPATNGQYGSSGNQKHSFHFSIFLINQSGTQLTAKQ